MDRRRLLRIAFAVVLVASLGVLTQGYLSEPTAVRGEEQRWQRAIETGEQVAEPRQNVTVVSALGSRVTNGQLIAFAEDGSLEHYEARYDGYGDVDPVPGTRASVLYVGHERLSSSECDANTRCLLNVIERVNLTTGQRTRLHEHRTPFVEPFDATVQNTVRWHDVDRVNETHVVVADISTDRVFLLDTRTGQTEWAWDAQRAYPIDGGGPYPWDWTHLNDVEVLADGRIMVSLRNQDQVVFLDRGSGVIENWTLGADGDHETLYEQHNPDYIPAERGGPAVLVADSENNQLEEFQRTEDGWEQSWVYQGVQWPRDADRLPNGHTLIVDSNGDRIIEVDRSGEIVWSVTLGLPYDAERLGTGDESATGRSAAALGLSSNRIGSDEDTSNTGTVTRLRRGVKGMIPPTLVNGIAFVLPLWMNFFEFGAAVAFFAVGLTWLGFELWWRGVRLTSPVTVE